MTALTFSDSIVVARPPADVYALVSDVTRTGEWSPICVACWWDDGAGPRVGAWFTGRNHDGDRTWETRSVVTVATPGEEFAWTVGGSLVRWGYTFAAVDGGTALTESWAFLPAGITRFHERYRDDAEAQIAQRSAAALRGIPLTLEAVRRAAEAG